MKKRVEELLALSGRIEIRDTILTTVFPVMHEAQAVKGKNNPKHVERGKCHALARRNYALF